MSKKESNQSPSHNQKNHTRPDFFGSSDNALRFLRWFCPTNIYESIEGDLLEQFEEDLKLVKPSDRLPTGQAGLERSDGYWERRAKRRLHWNVLKFFRPGILFRHNNIFKLNQLMISLYMLGNYIKIALRTMKRQKVITLINITGLAVCMSAGLLILILIKTHRSYDQFHPYPDRTYRIITHVNSNTEGWSPLPLADELSTYPFVEKSVTILNTEHSQIALSGKLEIPVHIAFTENSFFDLFAFHLVSGNEITAFTSPYSAVITNETSKKLFGRVDPLGKVIEIKNWGSFTVTGVIGRHEEKTHIASEIFISKNTLPPLISKQQMSLDVDSWAPNYENSTYALLKSSRDRDVFQQTLDRISEKTVIINKHLDKTYPVHFIALGLTEIPPPITSYTGGIEFGMTSLDMLAFSSFGLLFVLLAVFNYTNLTVARAFARAKEVGVRKITGALRTQIAAQIFVESTVIALFALFIAYFMARIIPVSPGLAENIDFTIFDLSLLLYSLCFALFVGFSAGLFPAIILSKIKPLQAMGNLLNTKLFKSLKARNALIVIQFSISLLFLTVVIVLFKQINYQVTADLGYDRRNILTVPLHNTDHLLLQAEIERHAAVIRTSASSLNPLWGNGINSHVAMNKKDEPIEILYYSVDRNFIPVWDIPLIAGSNFPDHLSQKNEQFIILNESAVHKLLLVSPADAIGKSVFVDSIQLQIAGVVKDFHFNTFRHGISPLMFRFRPEEFQQVNIKFQPDRLLTVEDHVRNSWNKFEPEFPVTPERFDEKFTEARSQSKDTPMVVTFSIIAIFVSCLGLFGVVLYSVEARSKEIAIRKIMGSSVARLTLFLSRNFFALLLISICIGLPLGYLISNQILRTYVYKIDMGVGIALTILTVTVCIGLITICSQTIRAALVSPINAVKND